MSEENTDTGHGKETGDGENGDQGSQTLLNPNTTDNQGQGDTGDTGADAGDAEGKADGEEGTEGEGGAPEAYEDFKLPEGFTFDGERKDTFEAFAKRHNLNQEGAQEAIDLYLKMQEEAAASLETALSETVTGWAKETQADPVLSQGNFDENIAGALKAVDAVQGMMSKDFGDNAKGLAEVFEETGIGNHPALAQMFYSLNKRLGEGSLHSGSPGNSGPKSDAEVLYPNT